MIAGVELVAILISVSLNEGRPRHAAFAICLIVPGANPRFSAVAICIVLTTYILMPRGFLAKLLESASGYFFKAEFFLSVLSGGIDLVVYVSGVP